MAQTEASEDGSYDEIEAALAATTRGRRFLAEAGRRSRTADTQRLLDAIAGLEKRLGSSAPAHDSHGLRDAITEMSDTIRKTRADIADALAASGVPAGEANETLDALADTTRRLAQDVLAACESVQEIAWTMREGGFDAKLCDALDQRATEIYTASATQGAVAQVTEQSVRSLAALDRRISGLNRIRGGSGEKRQRPALEALKLSLTQTDIDFIVVDGSDDVTSRAVPDPVSQTSGGLRRPADVAREAALAEMNRINALGTRERLSLFT